MAKAPLFSSREPVYARQWHDMQVEGISTLDKAARTLIVSKHRYQAVAAKVGCPWFFIACCHWREAGGSFAGVLHNGQKIIGTGRKTSIVPIGRGPFKSWEEAAIDALSIPPHDMSKVKIDSIERFAYEAEKWNGWGYFYKRVPSAYLWSFSNIYKGGKYVKDGVWSSTAKDQQIGVMPLLKRMMVLDASIGFGPHVPDLELIVPPKPPATPRRAPEDNGDLTFPPAATPPVSGGAAATVGVGAAAAGVAVAASLGLPWVWIVAGVAVAAAVAFGVWWFKFRKATP